MNTIFHKVSFETPYQEAVKKRQCILAWNNLLDGREVLLV